MRKQAYVHIKFDRVLDFQLRQLCNYSYIGILMKLTLYLRSFRQSDDLNSEGDAYSNMYRFILCT